MPPESRPSRLPTLVAAGLGLVVVGGLLVLRAQSRTIDRLDARLESVERANLVVASATEMERRIAELQEAFTRRVRRLEELGGGADADDGGDPWRDELLAEIDALRNEMEALAEAAASGPGGRTRPVGTLSEDAISDFGALKFSWGTMAPGNDHPSWAAGQAVGAPDTDAQGDHPTAWASREPDAGIEWLSVRFAEAIRPDGVVIVESYHPGAVVKVEVRGPETSWRTLWSGRDPSTPEANELFVPYGAAASVDEVRVTLDTRLVAGWNEIDAVGLTRGDATLWGSEATASSSYADR